MIMRVIFCGGAGEVGAACFLVKIAGKNILLDCGIRLNSGGKDALPDFRLIQEAGGVDAIFISHAHLDHTGSLPVISREYPSARIYMTHVTKDLVRVLLYDSLKIMAHQEGEIPIYAENHVRGMMENILCYSPQYSFKPFNDREIMVTFYPAGHVAGAVIIYIQSEEGALLYSGDLSVTRQQTVEGAFLPPLRPDVMIMESTYGDKLHSNRELEAARLVETIKGVILNNGKVLIPAFALGRAQEIILILKKAVNKGEIPPVKIYVDGMIRDINRIYQLNPNYLRESLAKKVFRGNEIFYDDNLIPVEDDSTREAIINSKESLGVIAGSGMLTGGYSPRYAESFAAEEKNFIAITGYQDEEAPGRKLLNLVEEEEKTLDLNGKTVPVRCGAGMYGLSAHADKGELQSVIHKLAPRKLFLVHGEEEVITDFAKWLSKDLWSQIYVPANGEDYDVRLNKIRKQRTYSRNIKTLNRGETVSSDNLKELWEYLIKEVNSYDLFPPEDLLYIWSGRKEISEDYIKEFRRVLNSSVYFEPDSRRPFLYRLVPEPPGEPEVMEMNKMFEFLEDLFPNEAGLYKKGARFEEKTAILYFNLPLAAQKEYAPLIQEFEEKTGWKAEIHPEYNKNAVDEVIFSLIPANVMVNKISHYRSEGLITVTLDREIADEDRIKDQFTKITGLHLEINLPGRSAEVPELRPVDTNKMMEQNAAFTLIEQYFTSEAGQRIYKKSKKESSGIPYIELSFISPEVGRRYQSLIEKLEVLTGWKIVIGKNPNLDEIIKKTREIIRNAGIPIKKNPSIYPGKGTVVIKIPPEAELNIPAELKDQVKEETGYELEFDIK